MKYTIQRLEQKRTTTGKDVKSVTLFDEQGVTNDRVSIWDNFPNWSSLKVGSEIEGEITVNEKGYKSLKPLMTQGFGRSPSGAVKAAEITKSSIKEAQERKNDSISYFNSLNSAIAFVNSFKKEMDILDSESAYNAVLSLRDRFLQEWKDYNDKPPF